MDILNFLAQAAGLGGQTDGEDITVTARRPNTLDRSPAKVQQIELMQENTRLPVRYELANPTPRKGTFGTKGTLRDVLGTLGDALLVGGGKDAVYAPQRHREKMSDALHVYNQDPEAGTSLLNDLDPMWTQTFLNDRRKAAVDEENKKALAGMRHGQTTKNIFDQIANLGGMLGQNPDAWGSVKGRVQELLTGAGYTGVVPDRPTPEFIQSLLHASTQGGRTSQMGDNVDSQIQQRSAQTQQGQQRINQGDEGLGIRREHAQMAADRVDLQNRRLEFEREREAWSRKNFKPRAPAGGQPRGDTLPAPRPRPGTAPPGTGGDPNRRRLPNGQIATYNGSGDRRERKNWTIK